MLESNTLPSWRLWRCQLSTTVAVVENETAYTDALSKVGKNHSIVSFFWELTEDLKRLDLKTANSPRQTYIAKT